MDTEQIAQITVKGESEGMDKVKSDIEGVTKAQGDLAQQSGVTATVTETMAKKHLDASSAYDKLHNSLDAVAGSTAAYEKRATLINTALSQGHITQAQAAADIALLAERYPKAAQAQDILAKNTSFLSSIFKNNAAEGTKAAEIATLLEGRQLRLASSVGLVGEVLSVVGPAGLAATAGIGAVIVGVDQLVGSANRMGELSREISTFSTVTGLSTDSVQALRAEGTKFGLSTEETGTFVEHFTYQLEAARDGGGALYNQLRKINPELAAQMSSAKAGADALNILAQATKQASTEDQKLALARSAGGKTAGGEVVEFLQSVADSGGVSKVTDQVNKLDLLLPKQVEDWKKLSTQIESSSTIWKNNIASIFTGRVLEYENDFESGLVSISRGLKTAAENPAVATLSSAWGTYVKTLAESVPVLGAIPIAIDLIAKHGASLNAALGGGEKVDAAPQSRGFSDFEATFGSFDRNNKTIPGLGNDPTIGAQVTDQKLLVGALGSAANASEQLRLKQLELRQAFESGALGAKDSADAIANYSRAGDRLKIDNETAQAADNQKAAISEIAAQYGNVSQKTAVELELQRESLAVTQARGPAEAAVAQQALLTTQYRLQSKSPEEASLLAAGKMVDIQAGIDKSIASQVTSLQQSTQLLNSGMDPAVQAAQAYANAIAKGASSTEAAALAAATIANNLAKADAAAGAISFQNMSGGAGSGGGTGFGGAPAGTDGWAGTKAGIPAASQQAMEAWNQIYGNGNFNVRIIGSGQGGFSGGGQSVNTSAFPTDTGTIFQDTQSLLRQAEQGMDAVTLARVQAGVAKIPNAQAIVDQFLAVGNNAANALAQKAAADFLAAYADTSSSTTPASLISPLYLSTSGYTGLGFQSTNSIAGQRLTQSNQPSVGGGTGGGSAPYSLPVTAGSIMLPGATLDNLWGNSTPGSTTFGFHAASGMDWTAPDTGGAADSIPIRGMISPNERLIAIPSGQQGPNPNWGKQDNHRPIVINNTIHTLNPKQAIASASQISAMTMRAAAAARARM